MLKKLLVLVGLSAIAYWLVRERLATETFELTEARPAETQPVG